MQPTRSSKPPKTPQLTPSPSSTLSDDAAFTPPSQALNSVRSSGSSQADRFSNSASSTARSSGSSSASTAISSYSALSPTHGYFASPPSIPLSTLLEELSSDDDIMNFSLRRSSQTGERKNDANKGVTSPHVQGSKNDANKGVTSPQVQGGKNGSNKSVISPHVQGGKKRQRSASTSAAPNLPHSVVDLTSDGEVIDLTLAVDGEVIDLTSDAEPSPKRQKTDKPSTVADALNFIVVHFHEVCILRDTISYSQLTFISIDIL
jgi:hypothetical protein